MLSRKLALAFLLVGCAHGTPARFVDHSEAQKNVWACVAEENATKGADGIQCMTMDHFLKIYGQPKEPSDM
jgi:PBP1b-binding outer membrane lipoprotein LpoB